MVFPYVAVRDKPSDSHEQAVQYAVQILEGEIPLRFAPWRLLGLIIACSSVLGCFALLLLR
jgi:hypothetical protein